MNWIEQRDYHRTFNYKPPAALPDIADFYHDLRTGKLKPSQRPQPPPARQPTPSKVRSHPAFRFDGAKLEAITIKEKSDQDFTGLGANRWELKWSRLCSPALSWNLFPIVDEDVMVVGHFGLVTGDTLIYGDDRVTSSERLPEDLAGLIERFQVFVGKEWYDIEAAGKKWTQRSLLNWYEYAVQTDPFGQVVSAELRRKLVNGEVYSVSYGPLDLLAIGSMIRLGIKALVTKAGQRRLSRRTARGGGGGGGGYTPLPPNVIRVSQGGDNISVSLKSSQMGSPGNLNAIAWADRHSREIVYEVRNIQLKGAANAADNAAVQLARQAHREMIVRTAKLAQKKGVRTFTLKGKQANPNFQAHANDLAQRVGIPGSGKRFPGSGHPDYSVTLDTQRVLAANPDIAAAIP